MPKGRRPVKAGTRASRKIRNRKTSRPRKTAARRAAAATRAEPLWLGTGLCPEAQGDGLPCRGVEGECERCGRALPR